MEGKTIPAAMVGEDIEEYLRLVRAFPLVHIRDDEHLNEALIVFEPLLEKPAHTTAEETYVMALADLIETYEDATMKMPPVSEVAMIRHLLKARDLTQEDLIPIFGTAAIVSEVLDGQREQLLTVDHIKKLASFFHVSPATFING